MQAPRSAEIVRFVPLICVIAMAAPRAGVQAQASASSLLRPVVPGYEHLRLAGAVGQAALGEILLGELNCLSCHQATEATARRIPTRTAPDLDRIGERATDRWLVDFLTAPHEWKPGSTMPEMLHSLGPDERQRVTRTLVGYLAFRGAEAAPEDRNAARGDFTDGFPVHRFRSTVERGRRLFHSVGCVACHAPEGAEANRPSRRSPCPT